MWPGLDVAKGMVVRIQLTGEMFKFEGSPELRNVSGWVDWRQFASVKDAAGTQLTMKEMEALPGLCIRILCTPAGMWFSLIQQVIPMSCSLLTILLLYLLIFSNS